jgi:hypothetical protein
MKTDREIGDQTVDILLRVLDEAIPVNGTPGSRRLQTLHDDCRTLINDIRERANR